MTAAAPRPGVRVLLARPDHLGDVLLTLPAVMNLRRALPGAHVTYLVPDGVAPVPRHCPAVDATLALAFPPLSAWPDPPGWADAVARAAPSLHGRFDLVILPRPDDPVSAALVAAADVPIRLGYASPRTRPLLTHALPAPDRRHVVALANDLVLAALDLLGAPLPVATDAPSACFVPTAAEEEEASAVLGSAPATSEAGPVVLHPGSGWPLKNWPARRWGHLAATLARRYGVAPLVTGGPHE